LGEKDILYIHTDNIIPRNLDKLHLRECLTYFTRLPTMYSVYYIDICMGHSD